MALRTYLTGIADAIREKKGTTDPINAQDFASEISSISTGGGGTGDNPLQALVDGKGAKGGHYLCTQYQGTSIDFLSNIDFSNTTDMSYMFYYCQNITTIPTLDFSKVTDLNHLCSYANRLTTTPLIFDTSSATNMSAMFEYCTSIETIPTFNTSRVTNLGYVFSNCRNLRSIPPIDTSSATNMKSMFSGCSKLNTIDITRLVDNSSNFTYNCNSLTKLIIRTMDTIPTFGASMFNYCYHMLGTAHIHDNPEGLQDGRIYVPDDKVDALKAATG